MRHGMIRSSRPGLAALLASLVVTLPVCGHAAPFASKPTHETILYSFSGPDGANPTSGLIADAAGALYGTTSGGGPPSKGTVFRLAPKGDGTYAESGLYAFRGINAWATPTPTLFP